MRFKFLLMGGTVLCALLFGGGVCSKQSVTATDVGEEAIEPSPAVTVAIPIPVDPSATPDLRGEPVDDTPAEVNEYKVRVIINGDVIDTLTFKYGETLSLTYMYKGLSVREWCYSVTYKHPDGHLYQRWFSALEENVTIKITKNQDIIGKSSVFYPAEIIPSNDSKATDNSIAEATSKPKETSQSNSKKEYPHPQY